MKIALLEGVKADEGRDESNYRNMNQVYCIRLNISN